MLVFCLVSFLRLISKQPNSKAMKFTATIFHLLTAVLVKSYMLVSFIWVASDRAQTNLKYSIEKSKLLLQGKMPANKIA